MEYRFKSWVDRCIKSKEITQDEIDKVLKMDRDFADSLFKEFAFFDRSAVSDFVFDCIADIENKKK